MKKLSLNKQHARCLLSKYSRDEGFTKKSIMGRDWEGLLVG
jgi:hypothetical protein